MIVRDFNIPVSGTVRSSKEIVGKDKAELNTTTDQLDLTDRYRRLYQTTTKCTLFSSSHATFTKRDYILGHKTELNKFKRQKSYTACLQATMELN